MLRLVLMSALVALLVGCGSSATETERESASPTEPTSTATLTPSASATESAEATASPSPEASEPAEPRALVGTWRTTLGGAPLALTVTETTYRIVRGSNAATGSVTIDGDRIEFFDSSLCAGTGTYSWRITDGALTFFPVENEPCPGRAEALLVRFTDYSAP